MDKNNRNWSDVEFFPGLVKWLRDLQPWNDYTEERIKKKMQEMGLLKPRPAPPPKQMELPLEKPKADVSAILQKADIDKDGWLYLREKYKDDGELFKFLFNNGVPLFPKNIDEFFGIDLELKTKVS